jgi:hypothetical protein
VDGPEPHPAVAVAEGAAPPALYGRAEADDERSDCSCAAPPSKDLEGLDCLSDMAPLWPAPAPAPGLTPPADPERGMLCVPVRGEAAPLMLRP